MRFSIRLLQLGREINEIVSFENENDARSFAASFSRLFNFHFWIEERYLDCKLSDYPGELAPFDVQVIASEGMMYSSFNEDPNRLDSPSKEDLDIIRKSSIPKNSYYYWSPDELRLKLFGYKVAEPESGDFEGQLVRDPVVYVSEEKQIYVLEFGAEPIYQVGREFMLNLLSSAKNCKFDKDGYPKFLLDFK